MIHPREYAGSNSQAIIMKYTWSIMIRWVAHLTITLVLSFITAAPHAHAQSPEPTLQSAIESLSTDRMLADIRTLSGPSFNGRQTGTNDDLKIRAVGGPGVFIGWVTATAHS